MRKYFDCMACEHSQSINGEKLQCVLRNKEVKNHNSCVFQTNLPEEFPVSFKHLTLEQNSAKDYPEFSNAEDLLQALEQFETEYVKQEQKRKQYVLDNFLTSKELSEQWFSFEKKELDFEESYWLLYDLHQEESVFQHLEYKDWKVFWKELLSYFSFYQIFENEVSCDEAKYYIIYSKERKVPTCLISECDYDYKEKWFQQEFYDEFMQKIYYVIAELKLFPTAITIEQERVIPKFKKVKVKEID